MSRFNIPAKKIAKGVADVGKSIAKDAFQTLLVKPGTRIGQLTAYGIASLTRNEKAKEDAFKGQKVNLGKLGTYDIKGSGKGSEGYRQAGGDALKAASYLYTPGGITNAAGKQTLKQALVQGAKSGAKLGGLYGAGESLQKPGDFHPGRFSIDVAKSAAVGAAGGAVLGGVGYGVNRFGEAISEGKFTDPKILELRDKWQELQTRKLKTTNKNTLRNLEKAQRNIEQQVSTLQQAGFVKNPFIGDEPNQSQLPPQKTEPPKPQKANVPENSYTYSEPQHASGSQPQNIQSSIEKLTKALQELAPITKEQQALYSAARASKIQKVLNVREKATGEQGFYKELGALKGELPKAQFESLRGKIAQSDIDNLFNAVAQTNKLGEFEKIAARQGLVKIFAETGGSLPTNSELKLLNQVFPPETIQALVKQQPLLSRVGTGVEQTLNIPRSVMASFDLSAPFRQGLFLVGKPKQFFSAFMGMFKQFGSETAYRAVQDEIASRPTYPLMWESKLALTDTGNILSNREEAFMSSWAEKIPVIGRAVHASGRAYTGFLNKLRADVFDSMLQKAAKTGVDVTPEVASSLAKFINTASGRGSLGALEPAANVLNGILFSPRLMASRVNMLNPMFYVRLEPFARKEALKTMTASGSIILTTLGLAKMGGADVKLDPRSADFLKIKIGNTRLDTLGGIQQYLRLAAQLASGKIISSTTGKTLTLGEGYKPLTRLDILERFFQGKENPIASFVTDWLQGQDIVGNKFKPGPALLNRFIPMLIQDLNDTVKEQGLIKGTGLTIPGIFGVGVQTYPNTSKSKSTKSIKSSKNRFNR